MLDSVQTDISRTSLSLFIPATAFSTCLSLLTSLVRVSRHVVQRSLGRFWSARQHCSRSAHPIKSQLRVKALVSSSVSRHLDLLQPCPDLSCAVERCRNSSSAAPRQKWRRDIRCAVIDSKDPQSLHQSLHHYDNISRCCHICLLSYQVHPGQSLLIKCGQIQWSRQTTDSCFVWLCTKAASTLGGLHLTPEICRRFNLGKIAASRTALVSYTGKGCRPPGGWFLSLPASQSRSDPTHSRHRWQRDGPRWHRRPDGHRWCT